MKSMPTIGKTNVTLKGHRYKVVAVGGTFDIIHAGHEKLLTRAFQLGTQVLIGVSSDRLVSRLKKRHPVKPFPVRRRQLIRLLRSKGWNRMAKIVKLEDPFGPALSRKRLDAIIVSSETHANANRINRLRQSSGLPSLRIHSVSLLKAKDGGTISATRIWKGQIDVRGTRRKRPSHS